MAERSPGAHVVRRRLGSALRKLREDANIRIEASARELECSPAKISRLENGQGPAKLWDVRILLSFYGVEDRDLRQAYEDWARATKVDSWWEPDADLLSDDLDRYFAAETVSGRLRIFCTPVPPVLLQTFDYAAAHIRILNPQLSEADIERFADLQRQRQNQLLRSEHPLTAEIIIDEAAVLRRVGTPAVHLGQLEWLVTLLEEQIDGLRTTLDIRLLPLSAGPGRATSAFTIFDPRDSDLDPVTAFIEETAGGGAWIEPVSDLVHIFDELRSLSVDADRSIIILREIISRGATPSPGVAASDVRKS